MRSVGANSGNLLDRLAGGYTLITYEQLGVKFLLGSTPCDESIVGYAQLYESENVRHVVRLDDHPYRDSALTSRGMSLHDLPMGERGIPSDASLRLWRSLVMDVQARNRPAHRPSRRGRRRAIGCPGFHDETVERGELECIAVQAVQRSSALFMVALALQYLGWDYDMILESVWQHPRLGLLPAHSLYLKGQFGRKWPRTSRARGRDVAESPPPPDHGLRKAQSSSLSRFRKKR